MIRRRQVLRSAAWATLASTAFPLWAAQRDDRPLAALLVPMTGAHADLARSLHHAADLAQPPGRGGVVVVDAGETAASAAHAAAAALKAGAPLLIGPLFGTQVAAVVGASGGVPVVALSNDVAAATGAFVLGVTPAQSVGAILGYARSRGVRRVAVDSGPSRWDAAAAVAAQAVARDLGLTLAADAPDARLVTGGADRLVAAARVGDGVQLLATAQALALSGAGQAAIDGTWLAAPDPDGFADFARRFEAAFGNPPGQIAGLVYDAVGIARTLRASGHLDRDGLTGSAGFPGVAGAVRFRADGSASRALAILVADSGGFRTVATTGA